MFTNESLGRLAVSSIIVVLGFVALNQARVFYPTSLFGGFFTVWDVASFLIRKIAATLGELPECRDAQDAKRDIPVPLSPSLVTTAYCAPAALRPCRFATPSQARYWLRSTPSNG